MKGVVEKHKLGEQPHDGLSVLFLLCDEPKIADPAWLGPVLARLGFLDDGDNGHRGAYPIDAQHWGTAIRVDAGIAVTEAVGLATKAGGSSLAGLDLVPDARHANVLALNLGQVAESRRTQAVQHLAFVAATLTDILRVSSLFWPPAALWSNAHELAPAVAAMEGQGMPPLLHFVSFINARADSAENCIRTRGLAWMAQKEIELAAPPAMLGGELLRRLARLAVDAMTHGVYSGPAQVPGLVAGELIEIAPLDSSGPVPIVRARVLQD